MKSSKPLRRKKSLASKPFDRPPTKGHRPSGLKRKAMKRKKARNAVSAEVWDGLREELYARSGGRCEVGGCDLADLGMHAHHRRLRAQGGRHELVNLIAACPEHHRWVHAHPAAARDAGWIVSAWRDPALVPVRLVDGGEVLLTAEGGYSTEMPGGAA